ncbi:MAG: RsmB/NOP family class I SAM-dependent RNA methyltransferase [Rhodobacteraceae bacterium]|nr:RsmB/NOP family class I SAM-dependent RNA methyltransferase [Paracoccaceae bacterium]
MTPGARLQAAIEVLDRVQAGTAPEAALTNWARASRFAGSGDRAAVRDHVYDVVRRKRSCAALGGGESGRALVLGLLRGTGAGLAAFDGSRHAPAPLTDAERTHLSAPVAMTEAECLDCPDWLVPALRASLGTDFAAVMKALRHRAPVFLRVNVARVDRAGAIAALAGDGIDAVPHPLADFALEVTQNARRVRQARAFADGLVEFQDAASQAVVAALPPLKGLNVLDYCAGGGGKALAMAALGARVTAHDVAAARMRDIPARAARAGVRIAIATQAAGAFDLVLADAPCSGSGSWRRDPAGKWALTPDRLNQFLKNQAQAIDQASKRVRPGGWLAYATCSMLQAENEDAVAAFSARAPGFRVERSRRFTPLDGADGFGVFLLRRD